MLSNMTTPLPGPPPSLRPICAALVKKNAYPAVELTCDNTSIVKLFTLLACGTTLIFLNLRLLRLAKRSAFNHSSLNVNHLR